MTNLILASASPRRTELLTQIGFAHTVMVSAQDESTSETDPALLAEELSYRKAQAVLSLQKAEGALVIGADTVVSCKGEILGKPSNHEDAIRMLTMLSGSTHTVYTGVSVCKVGWSTTFHEATQVEFYPMTAEEIEEYCACEEPYDKAGAYGIQGIGARYIKGIRGDYNNVVGLPVAKLYRILKTAVECDHTPNNIFPM